MRDYDIEAMQEILAEYDIEVSFDTANGIANDFIDCYITHREHEISIPDARKEGDYECAERLRIELDNLKRKYNKAQEENEAYNKYISKLLGVSYVGVEDGRIYFER